ncbi:hypothetical protein OG2516_17765 [Oceanicola granulosus HTCC2516]|uniref:Periplasmic iron-binding protein n=1 Tax=Oceanicola granulosus (strain ATCC BAA-861 / DSM 15982 / KCTC 12143 / HTCC2516) TaxID=314256 RepID=Q2CF27_OCEGH|nr:ABC transporter substrate-binding protein [Oceanicola granulosus]EAR51300.1 hypothetical protein OG2516_17765 [Oceanicola granulosus HTCC2516]
MIRLALLLWLVAALPARGAEVEAMLGSAAPDAPTVTLRTTTDFHVLAPVLEAFLATEPALRLRYEQWGSNDLLALSRAECAAGRAGADLVISSAIHHMVALVNAGCARPHASAETAALEPDLSWRGELFGIPREPVVMVYNRTLLSPEEVPQSRFDLLDLMRPDESKFRGRVATYDIEESGLGFLLAFSDSLEATTFGSLLEGFGASDAVATCCSAEIIEGVIRGDYVLAYNVLGSYALGLAESEPRLGIVAPSDYTMLLSRAAMIPRGSDAPDPAARLLDFLLSAPGRRHLARARLWVDLDDREGDILEVPPDTSAASRTIPLSLAMLVAMDAQTRAAFVENWRTAFPVE